MIFFNARQVFANCTEVRNQDGAWVASMNRLACLQINGNAFYKDVPFFCPLKNPNGSSCFVSLLDANGHSVK